IPPDQRRRRLVELLERERLRQELIVLEGDTEAAADAYVERLGYRCPPTAEDPLGPGPEGWPEELIAAVVRQAEAVIREMVSKVPGISISRIEARTRQFTEREARRLSLIHLAGLSTAAAEAALDADEGPLVPPALRLPQRL